MKITTFDPIIIAKDSDSTVAFFEALGFAKSHAPVTPTDKGDVQSYRMKNADGFHVDISQSKNDDQQDEVIIRMNVDDFDEAYDILTKHGFTEYSTSKNKTVETDSSKAISMVSPSGFRIAIVKHKKD
jgi:hypothetical protein